MLRTSIAITLLAAALLAARAGGSQRASIAAAPPVQVGFVIKALDNPFFLAMYEGARGETGRLGSRTTFRSVPSNADLDGQAAQLRAARAAHPDCYIVNPILATNLVRALRGVREPVINVDSPIDPSAGAPVTTLIGTDDVAAGRMAGRRMAALLPDGGDVALIGGVAGSTNSILRLRGFESALAGTRVRAIARETADYDRTKAEFSADRLLRSHPSIAGFFAANDDMALGVADALRAAGRTGSVRVIGVDGIAEAMDAIRTGALDATVSQYPYVMGAMAVEACTAAARGATLPKRVHAPIALLTRDNVNRAIASFPRPVGRYADPFSRLLVR
jgi:ABC-type sugar transport system substrate-binding protein